MTSEVTDEDKIERTSDDKLKLSKVAGQRGRTHRATMLDMVGRAL